jgi:hypothetical protein
MEDKSIMKKSFILLFTITLVMIFAFFSIRIVQTNMFSTNLNKLKYLHLQANIHLNNVVQYIQTHNENEIQNISLDDDRFELEIVSKNDNNTTVYYVSIKTKDDTHVRVLSTIIK